VLKAYSNYLKQSNVKQPLLIADLEENVVDRMMADEGVADIKPYVFAPGYIANTDLPALYNSASVFLYPSLRESFGIPQLEAMACGTPLIAGNTSAMPEIAGEGALLVDPFDADAITDKLLALENDVELYSQQVSYGLERVKQFSWRHTAEGLLKLYQEVGAK
jgi:glycosyltransferase involved in cell wall biosynthesis